MLRPLAWLVVLGIALQSVCAVDPWNTLEPSQFKLHQSGFDNQVTRLNGVITRRTPKHVLEDGDHALTVSGGVPPGSEVDYHWDDSDNDSTIWVPQGITTSADAQGTGVYGGHHMFLVSWYDQTKTDDHRRGSRITFVNLDDRKYRHVLFVQTSGASRAGPDYKALKIHAGGIALYGNLLYVVDTEGGLRVFDMRHIYEVKPGTGIGRQSDQTYEALGYKYILPQVRYFRFQHISTTSAKLAKRLPKYPNIRFSSVAVDRTTTPDSLLVGEYQDKVSNARVFRWDLDFQTRLLKTTNGVASASQALQHSYRNIQGSCSANGVYFLSHSYSGAPGSLITYKYATNDFNNNTLAFPPHPEDLSCDAKNSRIWTLTEGRTSRVVVNQPLVLDPFSTNT